MSKEYFLASEDKIQPAQLKKLDRCSVGRYSSVGSVVAWELRGTAINPRVREDLVMKIFLRSFFLFRCFKESVCQLKAKRCALSTGNLLRGGLPRNSVDRITVRLDMTSAVYSGRKASTQTNKR